jgi:Domain of unknown function (DUF1707)
MEPDIRISDAERTLAIDALGEHLATGRLDSMDYDERRGQVAAARTRAQLEELFADLPAPHPDLSTAVPPGKPVPAKPEDTRMSAVLDGVGATVLFLGVPGAIALTIAFGMWWTFFAIGGLFAAVMICADASRRWPDP